MIDQSSLENKLLFTPKEVSQILFGSTDRQNLYTVYSMIDFKDLDAKKVGKRWFIKRESLVQMGAGVNNQ